MRPVLIAISAAAALLTADTSGAQESFFNKRYCSIPGGANSGSLPDCSFNTWEQCRGGLTSPTRYCAENPNWRPDAGAQRTRARGAARGRARVALRDVYEVRGGVVAQQAARAQLDVRKAA